MTFITHREITGAFGDTDHAAIRAETLPSHDAADARLRIGAMG